MTTINDYQLPQRDARAVSQQNLLTLDEVRNLLRISKWSLQRLINDQRLPTVRIGRRRFVLSSDVDQLIDELRVGGPHGR